jgi:hypothetical protein
MKMTSARLLRDPISALRYSPYACTALFLEPISARSRRRSDAIFDAR